MPTPKICKNILPRVEKYKILFYLLCVIGLAILYPTLLMPILEDSEPNNVSIVILGMLFLFWGFSPLMAIHNIKNIDNPKRNTPLRKKLGTFYDWYFSLFITLFFIILICMTFLQLYDFVF